jgi:choice-of-anchor A domain-containing protein
VLGTGQSGYGNPSFFVLRGTNPTLNIFTITAAEFEGSNPIDIVAPAGSTIIVNVEGTNLTLGAPLYYNGVQYSGDSTADDDILFNFGDAQSVAIDAQFDASILAPFAILTGDAQMGGTFIAAEIGQTGEVHNDEFTGTLPPTLTQTPEPGTLALMGTGITAMAGLLRRRAKRQS